MPLRRTAILVMGIFLLSVSAFGWGNKAKKKRALPPPPVPQIESLPTLQPGPLAYWPNVILPPPPSDPVKKLIAEADAEYRSGVDAYHSGHLVKAKADFDRAVDLILESGLDLSAYPELQKKFDQLLDDIHGYELAALKEGDGFTERKPVSAPIDEVADLTFPVDPNLKKQVAQQVNETRSDLPLVINDQVLGYINYFSGRGQSTLATGLRRAGRYREMMEKILREEGVPRDLIYLAQAESAFQALALSRAGARGIWQFMPSRGREYGLERNWWVDLRQDPEKSTRAAARHLRDLYQMFGDWYLAMAAYNSGPAHVESAVARTGYADFWELYRRNMLPRETRNYVPIILAVTIMAKNPEKYGLGDIQPEPATRTDTVKITTPTDLRLIAEIADSSVELLQELNPSLLRLVTPNLPEFELKLPAGAKERFLAGIAMIPEDKRVWWRWHQVSPGETLEEIARNFKTTAAAIGQVNNLPADEPLQIGTNLVIPITPRKSDSLITAALGGKRGAVRLRYRSRKGDTVALVADRFGVSPSEVRRWNGLRGDRLRPGRVLLIHATEREYQVFRPRHHKVTHKSRNSRKIAASRKPSASHRAQATPPRSSGGSMLAEAKTSAH